MSSREDPATNEKFTGGFHLFLFQKLILMDLFRKAEGDVHTRKKMEKGDWEACSPYESSDI